VDNEFDRPKDTGMRFMCVGVYVCMREMGNLRAIDACAHPRFERQRLYPAGSALHIRQGSIKPMAWEPNAIFIGKLQIAW
jgi:hypothetical protein